MQMNRREAIKTMSLGSAAILSMPWTSAMAQSTSASSLSALAYPYSLPELPYAYDALAGFIDPETMQIHHAKHHAGYVNNLNKALEAAGPEWQAKSLEELLRSASDADDSLRTAIANHGGGHHNHSLFWNILQADLSSPPEGELAEMIQTHFGSVENLTAELRKASLSVFGSGWSWLVINNGALEVMTSANQDSPLMSGRIPLLGIDVWEHAYYLRYQNRRADYVDGVLAHINWAMAAAQL